MDSPLYSLFFSGASISIAYLLLLRKVKPIIGEHRWSFPVFQAWLFFGLANPVFAQSTVSNNASACNGTGLFLEVTNFVTTIFSTVSLGGVGGGQLSNLICQVVGFMIVGLVLAFIGTAGRVAYQIGYDQQPLSAVISPLFGFLIFAGGATMIIKIILG